MVRRPSSSTGGAGVATGGAIVVTGGTGGLGLGVCRVLQETGRRLVVTWVVEREVERAREVLGPDADLRRVDVTDAGELEALAADLDAGDGVWALAHLVGGYHEENPVASLDLEAWDRQVELNVRGAALAMRAFLPAMVRRGGGRVVAVSSRAALRPFAGASAYAASKAALIALVTAASEEVKHDGVTVNCILPSVIDTPANRAAQGDADHARWVKPEEIGQVIRFLTSPEASAVTGAALPVYGRA
jgi:NAD(P)-dependent dehydrogenase (short-subunit alcohol dehydrogenase family)